MNRITLKKISEMTGYSIATVSRVVNGLAGQHRISKKTEEEISKVVKELHYVPSKVAQSLRMNKTNTIGLIIPNIANPFFAKITKAIEKKAQENDYSIIVTDSEENAKLETEHLEKLLVRNIDGLLIVPAGRGPGYLHTVLKMGLPVIQIDRYFLNFSIPYVSTDNYQGAVLATEYLVQNGHKRIGCIQGVKYAMPNKQRVKGFLHVMQKMKGSTYYVAGDEFSVQNGYFETSILLNKPEKERPTAIFALSNLNALGALEAINKAGLRIPEDISLVTFDDQEYLNYLNPPLTSIEQPVEEIGQIAIKLLLRIIRKENGDYQKENVLLNPRLIIRQSVKNIK